MNGRISLVEQKKLQWAREREEMARLCAPWGPTKSESFADSGSRSRMSSTDRPPVIRDRGCNLPNNYGNVINLRNIGLDGAKSHVLGASLVSLHDGSLDERGDRRLHLRQRSPSLPPIYTKEPNVSQKQFDAEGSRYHGTDQHPAHYSHNSTQNRQPNRYSSPREDREGETSGYASDSAEVLLPVGELPACKLPGTTMPETGWQHLKNYCPTPDSSLPPSRKLSAVRGGPELRPRWGSLWGQEIAQVDPPPPSWLERGLSRLDHTSQVLVINHESASSPDSSTTGSAGSDSNKTYLRGQNVPVDADVLQEREIRRQKALELQTAIKQQLEERDRQRKEEQEQRMREERREEERIRREREKEKERFEEEQRRLRDKENAKQKKEDAMREVLEAAERLTKEKKNRRWKRDVDSRDVENENDFQSYCREPGETPKKNNFDEVPVGVNVKRHNYEAEIAKEEKSNNDDHRRSPMKLNIAEQSEREKNEEKYHNNSNAIQLPIRKEIAIVLSGRLDDADVLNTSNLKVNLIVQSPRQSDGFCKNDVAFIPTSKSPGRSECQVTSKIVERTRLLTPSKYRGNNAREFGTQTDMEDLTDNIFSYKQTSSKERKESINANRREVERSTNTGQDYNAKPMPRSKAQSRSSLETRPRWNANRPGTRYRTQSEKDPHYQRRLRLRRRQLDSSDEGSRSPSLDRRKHNNSKGKTRNATRRKFKLDSYDADLSMDSLNSIVPLRVDKDGRINIESKNYENKSDGKVKCERDNDKSLAIKETNVNLDAWCGQEILSQLTTLRNGLLTKQKEWDSQRCLVSPSSEFY